jgi:PEP-CTERM motif
MARPAAHFGGVSILGLTVTLQDSSFAVIGSDKTPANGFTFNNLGAGTYALNVLGYAGGISGGYYDGQFTATTAPVPEPQTYALMLAGLAAVGFAASRRKSKA